MNCKLITTASNIEKTAMLQKSLKKFNWDYEILVHKWEGFGGKIIHTYRYLKTHPEITHFFYSDSYDTIVLKTMEETLKSIKDFDCILMSAERGCYPHPEKEARYPKHDSPWHFVNGGGWFCNSAIFILAVEANSIHMDDVDQVWFTDLFLNHPEYMKLDYNCEVFQTIAFCPESDFYTEKVNDEIISINCITRSRAAFWHSNGHSPFERWNKLLAE